MMKKEDFRIGTGNPELVEDSLVKFFRATPLADQLYRNAVFDAWDKISGYANYTSSKYIKDKTLYITLSSSVLRSTLRGSARLLLSRINNEIASHPLIALDSSGNPRTLDKLVLR